MKKEIFSKRLKTLRKNKKITQKALAEDLGISLSSIIHYENAQRFPVSGIISLVSMYFDVSKEYLLGATDDPKPLAYEDEETIDAINDTFEGLLKKLLDEFNSASDKDKKSLSDIMGLVKSIVTTKGVDPNLKSDTLIAVANNTHRENEMLKLHTRNH